MPLPAPPSPRSHASAPTLSRGLSLYLSLQHTLETQLLDSSLAQISTIPPSRSWVLFCTQPCTSETRCRRGPPNALLSTMVHGLASYPLAAREDLLSPSAVTQRPCSLTALGLATEFLDVSAVPFWSLAPQPPFVFFSRVYSPPSSLIQLHFSFALPSTSVSPSLRDNPENQCSPFPHLGSSPPRGAWVWRRSHPPSHLPPSLPCFPTTQLAPCRPGPSAATSQRLPIGCALGARLQT